MSLTAYQTIGRSGLRVSPLCLGGMTLGDDWKWGANAQDSEKIIRANGGKVPGSRMDINGRVATLGEKELKILDKLTEISKVHQSSQADISLAWVKNLLL